MVAGLTTQKQSWCTVWMSPTMCWTSRAVRTGYSLRHCVRAAMASSSHQTPLPVNCMPVRRSLSAKSSQVLTVRELLPQTGEHCFKYIYIDASSVLCLLQCEPMDSNVIHIHSVPVSSVVTQDRIEAIHQVHIPWPVKCHACNGNALGTTLILFKLPIKLY